MTRIAFGYLARLHKSWGTMKTLPDLEEIRFKYLYGNRFSEEGKGTLPIAMDPALAVLR